jgi:hypothetical protein
MLMVRKLCFVSVTVLTSSEVGSCKKWFLVAIRNEYAANTSFHLKLSGMLFSRTRKTIVLV